MEETQTIVVQVEPAPADPERVQDYMDMFWLFALFLVVLWGLKRIYHLFSGDTEK